MKKWLTVLGVLVLLVSIFLLFFSNKDAGETDDLLSLNLKEHKNIAMHIHPTVEIYALGKREQIPKDIGISTTGMRVIHTHDSSGKLHIESPRQHQFYLKDFFTVWGKTFNSSCILDYCADEKHKVTVTVNGIENNQYGEITLQDNDLIQIFYEEM